MPQNQGEKGGRRGVISDRSELVNAHIINPAHLQRLIDAFEGMATQGLSRCSFSPRLFACVFMCSWRIDDHYMEEREIISFRRAVEMPAEVCPCTITVQTVFITAETVTLQFIDI